MVKKRHHLIIAIFRGLKINIHAPYIYLSKLWKGISM